MANQKYNNLSVLMASGPFNWVVDPINAYLMQNAIYDATDIRLGDTSGIRIDHVPVQGRQVDATGSLLGLPVSYNRVTKDLTFQVIIAKDVGPGTQPLVLAFFDEDEDGEPLTLKNNGTLIVRPQLVEPDEAPLLGVWVKGGGAGGIKERAWGVWVGGGVHPPPPWAPALGSGHGSDPGLHLCWGADLPP